jgi:phenylalanyl-tRNA synthetase beta chain
MLVSWNWLKQYVPLDMPLAELERRLMMAGLNHEKTDEVAGDLAIDLEVTSNRPDCLGYIGIAREVAVLWGTELKLPAAQPAEEKTPADRLVKVRIDCPDLCLRYTARVVRGVKIGPSPRWMTRRLEAVGLAAINNVVDISNYVLMECGQPLHTFDFGKLKGGEIVVRRPQAGETIEAIDHKTYPLGPEMCMICDAQDPVAIGGVMGGAQTEIAAATRDVLVEAAEFDPVSIRNTARQLNLHSDSSYRFERRVDPEGLDWASRRCCELILELAGGRLAAGMVDVGRRPPRREPIVLRLSQLKRVLGIDVPECRVREILLALGNEEGSGVRGQGSGASGQCNTASGKSEISNLKSEIPNQKSEISNQKSPSSSVTVVPPSWRRDLTREIDLIEEVARIHGYEAIPEDVGVPMVPSARRREDRVLEKIRHVLTASGFDEAMTLSVIDVYDSAALSPWTDAEPLRSQLPVIRGADCLRRSLVPSLLDAQRINESLANRETELFEIAKVYLPREGNLPTEELMVGLASARRFIWRGIHEGKPQEKAYRTIKGIIEEILSQLRITTPLQAETVDLPFVDHDLSCRLMLGGEIIAFIGALTLEGVAHFHLLQDEVVAEVRLSPLFEMANLVPKCVSQSSYPAIGRDLNLVVDETVQWADVAATVRGTGGPLFESLEYRDTYRDPERLGQGKKSLLFSIALRSSEGTLTSEQADAVREQVVAACRTKHGAELRA